MKFLLRPLLQVSLFSKISVFSRIVSILLGFSYEFSCLYICYPIIFDPDNIWCWVYALMHKTWFKAMIQTNKNKTYCLLLKFLFFLLVNKILLAIFENFDDFQTLEVNVSIPWRLFCFITRGWSIIHVRNVCDQCISNKADINKLVITCRVVYH